MKNIAFWILLSCPWTLKSPYCRLGEALRGSFMKATLIPLSQEGGKDFLIVFQMRPDAFPDPPPPTTTNVMEL